MEIVGRTVPVPLRAAAVWEPCGSAVARSLESRKVATHSYVNFAFQNLDGCRHRKHVTQDRLTLQPIGWTHKRAQLLSAVLLTQSPPVQQCSTASSAGDFERIDSLHRLLAYVVVFPFR